MIGLRASFSDRNGRVSRHRLSRSIQAVRHRTGVVDSEVQFNFHLLNESLAAESDRLRPAFTTPMIRMGRQAAFLDDDYQGYSSLLVRLAGPGSVSGNQQNIDKLG
jgi:hypothetical protein